MNREKLPLTVKSGYGIGDLVAGLAIITPASASDN